MKRDPAFQAYGVAMRLLLRENDYFVAMAQYLMEKVRDAVIFLNQEQVPVTMTDQPIKRSIFRGSDLRIAVTGSSSAFSEVYTGFPFPQQWVKSSSHLIRYCFNQHS